jgi:putative membrane protein
MMTGFGMGFGLIGLLFMVLFWGGLILLAVLVVRALFPSFSRGSSKDGPLENSTLSPKEILDQRYARGELTREQYEMMKEDLA